VIEKHVCHDLSNLNNAGIISRALTTRCECLNQFVHFGLLYQISPLQCIYCNA